MSSSRIVRRGTVDLPTEQRSAKEIVREGTDGLEEGLTYGEAIRALQATIEELRHQASIERFREAEEYGRRLEQGPCPIVERRLSGADAA